jgi:peptide-methionine (S)-S-oxide reductase
MTRKSIHRLAMALLLLASASCKPAQDTMSTRSSSTANTAIPENSETATLGAGCYWCIDAAFRQFDGVHQVSSGFMGGAVENPSYEQVCSGQTGHAEVVQIVFDPEKISYPQILDWFWKLHDPTTLNRQGNDIGTQYRSVIFYHSEAQKKAAEESKKAAASMFDDPIVTEIAAASTFYPAPEFHQDYYFQNKSKNPYCKWVIEPKLKKLKLDH